jgi:hypothetical protein
MPDPDLQGTALRYAAGDLSPAEASAFEARLADDQAARDALAEAVRLSAQAIGQAPPAPRASVRAALRHRLSLRAYRGSPLAWSGLGAAAVAACTILGLTLAGAGEPTGRAPDAPASADVKSPPRAEPRERAAAPSPVDSVLASAARPRPAAGDDPRRSVAEIWADLSSHEGVEKARDAEVRWRHHVRDLGSPHVAAAARTSAGNGVRER